MAAYTVGRRRVIALLLLTSILLLTLDLRGNAVFDGMRTAFGYVLSPFETAARVVTTPITDAWRGIRDYDDVVAENQRLQEQIDAQRGAEIAARNAIVENQTLLALNELESLSSLPTVTARFIGESPNNIDQIVEIDRGSDQGIDVGMAVVNEAGLVGRVTRVFPGTSLVRLITDPEYAVPVKILSVAGDDITTTTVPDTVPSGLETGDVTTTTSTTTTTTVPTGSVPGSTPGSAPTSAPPDGSVPGSSVPGSSVPPDGSVPTDGSVPPEGSVPGETTTTTTTIPAQLETGVLVGLGPDRLPQVTFITDSPTLGRVEPGDGVYTTGGRLSLAPPDIPVGVVRNVIREPGSAGTRLEVELSANLSKLQFVRVVLYKPPTEAGG